MIFTSPINIKNKNKKNKNTTQMVSVLTKYCSYKKHESHTDARVVIEYETY